MRVDFEMFGETQFSRSLERISDRAGNAKPVFAKIGRDWMNWNEEQFDSEGARSSGGWDPLAASTIASKGHDQILFDSGDLFDEMVSFGNLEITDEHLYFAIDDEVDRYARIHQRGGDSVPRRRVLEFTDLDRTEMVKDLQLWLIKGRLR